MKVEQVTLTRPEGADYPWLPWKKQEQKVQEACKGKRVGLREEAGR